MQNKQDVINKQEHIWRYWYDKRSICKRQIKKPGKNGRKPLQELYTAYGLERALYRLSVSEYADRFALKGGILLYALFGSEFPRVTRDIDFLAQHISNDAQSMKEVFQKVFSIEEDDALKFDIDRVHIPFF